MNTIHFGTDGWRGVLAREFTYENLRQVAQAHAHTLLTQYAQPTVVIGYDTRFQGQEFATFTAEVMAECGVNALLSSDVVPTPALSYGVVNLHAQAGVMISASHNPARYNGYKVKSALGASASNAIIGQLETALLEQPRLKGNPAYAPAPVTRVDLRPAYYQHLASLLDLSAIASLKGRIYYDSMGGAGHGWLPGFLKAQGIRLDFQDLRPKTDPLFYGVNPEPIQENLHDLLSTVAADPNTAIGLATDGDADRIGVVAPGGQYFNSHKVFAVLLDDLAKQGKQGKVIKTVSGSQIIELIAQKYGLETLETPIGFKYIAEIMQRHPQDILLGGEESGGFSPKGHIPERDGLLIALMLMEMLGRTNTPLTTTYHAIERDIGFRHHYTRMDYQLSTNEQARAVMQYASHQTNFNHRPIVGIGDKDGIKWHLNDQTTILYRASGTEPVLRIYIEAGSQSALDSTRREVQTTLQELGVT